MSVPRVYFKINFQCFMIHFVAREVLFLLQKIGMEFPKVGVKALSRMDTSAKETILCMFNSLHSGERK